MIKSMTGYGRSELVTKDRKVIVEIKAINHRYSDITIKMSRKLSGFETPIRSLLKEYIGRGKADVYITYEDYTKSNLSLKYNHELAKEYYDNLNKISQEFKISNDINASIISRYPEVFTLEEQSTIEDETWLFLEQSVKEAANKLVETRIIEGRNLKNDINNKLKYISKLILNIEERTPQILSEYRMKITNKVKELLENSTIDESVILTEVTIFADKICTDEEVVRLKSHITNMEQTLNQEDNVGRKLDFIAQEMNREANTILSKSNDIEVSNMGINLKTEIEKIREQIQNIE